MSSRRWEGCRWLQPIRYNKRSAFYLARDFFPRAFRAPGEFFAITNARMDQSDRTEPTANNAQFLRVRPPRVVCAASPELSSQSFLFYAERSSCRGFAYGRLNGCSPAVIHTRYHRDEATTLPRASVLNNRGRDIPSRFELSSPLLSSTSRLYTSCPPKIEHKSQL